jgi:hypothetical protein
MPDHKRVIYILIEINKLKNECLKKEYIIKTFAKKRDESSALNGKSLKMSLLLG